MAHIFLPKLITLQYKIIFLPLSSYIFLQIFNRPHCRAGARHDQVRGGKRDPTYLLTTSL
jgi:hypothetical protein